MIVSSRSAVAGDVLPATSVARALACQSPVGGSGAVQSQSPEVLHVIESACLTTVWLLDARL